MESYLSDKLFDDALTPQQLKDKQKAIDKQVCDVFLSRVPIKTANVVTRNIVIIGRTRSGKSTFKKFLVNPTIVAENMTIFSDTKEAQVDSFLLYGPEFSQYNSSNVLRKDRGHERSPPLIVLNIMDTPGLFESRDNGEKSRSNSEILRLIEGCMKREICQYHAIFFCASLDTGTNKEDLDSFMIIRDFLGKDVANHACLIITRCESKTEAQRATSLEEMRRQTQYKELIDFFKGGVFFSGALNFDDFNVGDEGKVKRQFQEVINMRKTLLNFIYAKNTTLDLMNLNFSDVRKALDEQKRFAAEIKRLQEIGTSKAQEVKRLQEQLNNTTCSIM